MRAHGDWWTVALLGPGTRGSPEAAALRALDEVPSDRGTRVALCPGCQQVMHIGGAHRQTQVCADRQAGGDRHGHALERSANARRMWQRRRDRH